MTRSTHARQALACALRASPLAVIVFAMACGGGPAPAPGEGTPGTNETAGGGGGGGGGGAGGVGSGGGGGSVSHGGGGGGGGGVGHGGGGGGGNTTGGGGASGGGGSTGVDAGGVPPGETAISDTFTGTNNTTIAGMAPDVTNLPGGLWTMDSVNTSGNFEAFIDTGDGNPAPSLHLYDVGGSTGSAALPIATSWTYTKPVKFSLQVDIKELNPGIILMVGFYGTLPAAGAASLTGFTGLGYHTDTGSLDLVEDGVTKSTLPFTGTFQNSGYNTLSFSIDTSTGAISSVSLTGNKGSYAFSSSAFTDAATDYVVFGTEPGGAQGACQYFDNLVMKSE